jgi:hypothetical protein
MCCIADAGATRTAACKPTAALSVLTLSALPLLLLFEAASSGASKNACSCGVLLPPRVLNSLML